MRAADPAEQAIAAIESGLASYFADRDRRRLSKLRQAIADRIEADLALLDRLSGDPDIEQDAGEMPEGLSTCCYPGATEDDEPSLGSLGGTMASDGDQGRWASGGCDEREVDAGDEPEGDDERECERFFYPPDCEAGALFVSVRRRRA